MMKGGSMGVRKADWPIPVPPDTTVITDELWVKGSKIAGAMAPVCRVKLMFATDE